MKKITFLLILMLLTLGIGSAWADVNCDFTTQSASHGAYTDSWKYGNFTVFGGANNNKAWAYVKMGGKNTNLSQANPVYISSPKMTSAISKVQVSIIAGSLAKTGMSVNSWGVYVYSDANMTNQVDYVAGGTISKNAAVFEFTPTTGTTWSANNYYKVSFDLKNTTTTNGIIWLDKVTFVESTNGGGETPDPTCTAITPTLSYESTTLLTGNNSSNPSITGNTGGGNVTYASSNTEVATVDASTGVITAVKAGTATITATIAAASEYCEGKATANITVKQLVSCADIYNLADNATFVLKDFVVTYVNGKYTYIKDGTGYGLIYKESYGLNAGDQVVSGKFEGKRASYNGLVEIIPTTAAVDLHATNGTVPEPELMDTNPIAGDMNKYVKFKNVSFASTAFSSKSINGTIEGQGSSIKFYDQFATNKTFDTSKKYDVIGVVSMFNSVQVNFISAEEVAEPTLNLTTTPIDFGKVAINSTNESTLQLSGSLLTKDITLSVEGDSYFTVSANSITPSEESVNETITITYKPTVEGTHTATLKITSDELEEQTITLEGQAAQQHTVHFYVNGKEQTELAKTILSDNTLDALPEEPESCDPLTYPTFAGWTTAEIVGTTDTKPTMLDLSTPITSDCNYYAVFEKATVSGSSEEQTETITISNFKSSGDGEKRTCETNSATWTWLKNNASSTINVTYEEIRLYQYHSMTISQKDGCDISKIVVDINTGKPASDFAGNLTGATMSLNENTATLTPKSEDIVIKQLAQSRVNSFVVTYTTSTTTYEYITSCAVVVPTCEITYDYASGEGECTNAIVEEGSEYTLCATAPTKVGHTFLNWKDQNGVEYAKGATINSVTEDLTLTAQWQVNSYEVTWMSLGEEVTSNSANHNTQPTKPANPTYTCGTDKEFVGWTTQKIDGVGVPANLYTDEFPVVTKAITYHAVFASINSSTESTTHTLTPNDSWSGYKEGTITDDKGYTWSYNAAGQSTGGVYSLNLRNKDTETSYIGSPSFAANVKSIKATIVNGSASKARKVYVCSAPTLQPTTGDLGITEVAGGHSGELSLAFEGTISQFYLQVSDALQFQSIVVEVGADPYTDYTTSCPTLVTPSVEKGIFSVGNGEFVQFSTGNLQYEVGTNTWSFAANQYDYIGEANINVGDPDFTGTIDLFGWSTNDADNNYGVNPNNVNELYDGTFQDWGTKMGEGWSTLSADQWKYLLNTRTNASSLKQIAKVNNDEKDIVGIMLFPDAWTMPADVNVAAAYDDYFKVNIYNYTLEQWTKLEEAGAVFLPAAGRRTGGYGNMINKEQETETNSENLNGGHYKHYDNGNIYCYYWTSTINETTKNVSYLHNIQALGGDKYTIGTGAVWGEKGRYGQSVRLVKKATPDYERTVTSGDYGTICLPNGGLLFGASAFSVAKMEGTTILLDEVGTTMVGGTPYVVFPNTGATKLYVFYTDNVNADAGYFNGLYGSYIREKLDANDGNYIMLPGNKYAEVTGDRVYVGENRAYFRIADISPKASAPAPGVRRIAIGQAPQVATGMENIDASAQPVKTIINGQLYILRGEKMYDAQGKLVK